MIQLKYRTYNVDEEKGKKREMETFFLRPDKSDSISSWMNFFFFFFLYHPEISIGGIKEFHHASNFPTFICPILSVTIIVLGAGVRREFWKNEWKLFSVTLKIIGNIVELICKTIAISFIFLSCHCSMVLGMLNEGISSLSIVIRNQFQC